MKKYKISFGTGLAWNHVEIIEAFNEAEALDIMIDKLEEEGSDGYFIDWSDTIEEGGDVYEDEYIIGGNHGRILRHYGNFYIEEV